MARAQETPADGTVATRSKRRPWWRRPLLALAFGLLAAAVVLELSAQAFVLYLQRTIWHEMQKHDQHFFQKSPSKILGYEMRPNWSKMYHAQWLSINENGIRDRDNDVPRDKWKVALLGDSIVFGNNITQERIVSELLQDRIDSSRVNTRVLNFGASGYSIEQIMEFLREKDAIYDVDFIVYVMNPNDFCRNGTVTEGSDSSLYRMYNPTLLKSPWLIRKGIYRLIHGPKTLGTDAWHRWIFRRNGDVWKKQIDWLASYAKEHGQGLLVLPFPAGSAYHDGAYALTDINDTILAYLRERGIPCVDMVPLMKDRAPDLFDQTNHCTDAGNVFLADLIKEELQEPRRRALEKGLR